MIKINNLENFLKKLKNAFANYTEPKDQVQKDGLEISNEEKQNDTSLHLSSDNNEENIVSTLENQISNDLNCLNALENYESVTNKNILFKVEKSKFDYPTAKSTTLKVKGNLPIITDIQLALEKKQFTDNILIQNACDNGKEIYGSYTLDYTSAQMKLFVDFSVVLYNRISDEITECPDSISNLDIYGLEKSSIETEQFDYCYLGDCIGLSPYDFSVDIIPIQTEVSPVLEFEEYYLYIVSVDVVITFLPPVTLNTTDTQTLAAINAQLGEDPTNNVFTRGQLASITRINLSNNPDLDFDIFQYLFNLIELNISSTTSDPAKLSKLSVLKKLEILTAKNNSINDYLPFADLTSLKELYLDNDVITGSSFDTADTEAFNTLSVYDITPLTNLVNLKVLSLSNNSISVIPQQISNLTKLTYLNLNNNNIGDLSNLYSLGNLSLEAKNQNINYGSLAPDIDDPTMFILDLSFLKDVDFTTPNILEISNGGIYFEDQSYSEPAIIWQNITSLTEVYFTFANTSENFTGKVTLTLKPSTTA